MKRSERFGPAAILLTIIVSVFLAVRLPVTLLSRGGQDEEWYAVPGLTVAEEGIPRVPYSRATDADSIFFGAEEMLFTEPPLSFYAQAPFFAIFPATYGTARLASLVAACLSIVLTYQIGLLLLRNRSASILAAALFSVSRLCYFPAMVARPDMICGTLGLMSVLAIAHWRRSSNQRWLIASGLCVGFAALAHPFAIVFGIQLTLWVLAAGGEPRVRVGRLATFAAAVTVAFAAWVPMIAMHPDYFRAQFIGNMQYPPGPSLLQRMVMPWDSFSHQIPMLIDRAHPIQFTMLTIAILALPLVAWYRRDRAIITCWLLTVSSVYLLVVCLYDHPIQGFWCYSASLGWLCFAYVSSALYRVIGVRTGYPRLVAVCGCVALLGAMLPGSGLRASFTYTTKFRDPIYSNPQFVRNILADLPSDVSLTVGPEFSLNAYAQRRNVILACRYPKYFDSADTPTDYYIFGRRDLVDNLPQAYRCELVRRYGTLDDVFANYAEVYRRASHFPGVDSDTKTVADAVEPSSPR